MASYSQGFIELHDISADKPILIVRDKLLALQDDPIGKGAFVWTLGGSYWAVKESVEHIMRLLRVADSTERKGETDERG